MNWSKSETILMKIPFQVGIRLRNVIGEKRNEED